MDQYDSLGFDPCDKKPVAGGGSAQSGRLHTEEEIYRSMKINDTSKTPYSDATQVSYIAPSPLWKPAVDQLCFDDNIDNY